METLRLKSSYASQQRRDRSGPEIFILAYVRDPLMKREFLSACHSLGFSSRVVTASSLTQDVFPIVITDGDDTVQANIANALSSAGVIASLVLLKNGLSWHDQLLRVTRDISNWPVNLSALEFRLSHAVLSKSASDSQSSMPGLDGLGDLSFVGESAPFRTCVQRIRMCARSDAPVLICGETGTGKDLAARALHYWSDRRNGPLIPLNCGAVPESLFENELFGHARGAYTDAKAKYSGLVDQADGGTLFLDEVDTLTPRSQIALLRFLQDFSYRPLGAEVNRTANVRLISASNRDLHHLAKQGSFRRDLLYRLDVLELRMPPLRDRIDDIEPLIRFFLDRYQKKYQKHFDRIDVASMQWLKQHPWPGNIRELEHYVHRAVVLCQGRLLTMLDESTIGAAKEKTNLDVANFRAAKAAAISNFEIEYLRELLKESHGNVTKAAVRAGKERRAFGKLIKKYRIDRQQFIDPPLS